MSTRIGMGHLGVGLAAVVLAGCMQGNVFELEAGTCFDDVDALYEQDGEIDDLPIVDCDQAHDNEVYATFDLPDGDFPADVADAAVDGCLGQFSGYVGSAYETSRYDIAWLEPTVQTWRDGDREVVCFLYDADLQPLVGSARGTAE